MRKKQSFDEIVSRLHSEFIDESNDRLDNIDNLLVGYQKGEVDAVTVLAGARREAHSMKGLGGAMQIPALSQIAHRMEDYMEDLQTLEERHLRDLQVFADRMRDVSADHDNLDDAQARRILRSLPVRWSFDVSDIEIRDVEVLLITANKVVSHKVERELQACGFRVVSCRSSLDAFQSAITNKPDLIMASAVMDTVGGVDLGRAFGTMAVTRNIPFAILTSFERGHAQLAELPDSAAVVRLTNNFADDLADVITRFDIG